MTSQEQIFYTQIGQLSTRFSNLESQIKKLIYILTRSNDEFVSSILIENNSISMNLKLLSKLSKYHEIEGERIQTFLKSIDKIRINRNLFIHGLWSFYLEGNDLVYVCEIRKVEFKKVSLGFVKILNKFLEFRQKDFDEELIEIANCTELVNEIIDELENNKHW